MLLRTVSINYFVRVEMQKLLDNFNDCIEGRWITIRIMDMRMDNFLDGKYAIIDEVDEMFKEV
jgi:hypothetical protein